MPEWTTEQDQRLTAMRADGVTSLLIGKALGHSKHAIEQRARLLQLPHSAAVRTGTWMPERVLELQRRWDDGESSGSVAAALGVSRNTVLGKLHREALKNGVGGLKRGRRVAAAKVPRVSPKPHAKRLGKALVLAGVTAARQIRTRKERKADGPVHITRVSKLGFALAGGTEKQESARAAVVAMASAGAWAPLPERVLLGLEPVRIEDHREGQCRWPIGSLMAVDDHYCGAPVTLPVSVAHPISVYCGTHRAMAYKAGSVTGSVRDGLDPWA